MSDIKTHIEGHFSEALHLLQEFISAPETLINIERAAMTMANCLHQGGTIFSCGNGGSFCDAMHFAEELTGRYREDRPPFRAIAISDASHITCVANDFGFQDIYSRYLQAHGKEGDVLLAISTSGNSLNIVNAAESAAKKKMTVIALTGKTGGKLAGMCDIEIRAPYSDYADRAQEIHIKVIHALIDSIEKLSV